MVSMYDRAELGQAAGGAGVAGTTPDMPGGEAPTYQAWRMERSGDVADTRTGAFSRAANAFAATATSAALLTVREPDALTSYVVTPVDDPAAPAVARTAAEAVGARAVTAALPDLTAARAVRTYRIDPKAGATSSLRDGADIAGAASALATSMPPGSWVAVSLREPVKGTGPLGLLHREVAWYRKWYLAYREASATATHHSLADDAVIITISAGAASAAEAERVLRLAASQFPGFDAPRKYTDPRGSLVGAWTWLALAVLLGVVGTWAQVHGSPLWLPTAAAGTVAALTGWGSLAARGRRTFDPLAAPPPAPALWLSRPHKSNGDTPARPGAYPLHPTCFKVLPEVVLGMIAPQAGAESGTTVTGARPIPTTLRGPVGPYLGDAMDGSAVRAHLDAAALWRGVLCLGEEGGGKSEVIFNLWAHHLRDLAHPTGLPGMTGRGTCLIAFETKGEGCTEYLGWAHALGVQVGLVDLADPDTWAIDLFGPDDRPARDRAAWFVGSMAYAWPDGDIRSESESRLTQALTAGLLLAADPALAQTAALPTGMSPVYYAGVVVGREGDPAGERVHAAFQGRVRVVRAQCAVCRSAQSDGTVVCPTHADLHEAANGLTTLYGPGTSATSRRDTTRSPRNKIDTLMEVDAFFTPTRRKVTWEQVLTANLSTVVNLGSSPTGRKVPAIVTERLGAMLLFTLKQAIEDVCTGWGASGRSVALFSDELSMLCGSNEQILAGLRAQGRSYGVRLFFATQNLGQLPPTLQNTVLGFGTVISFRQRVYQVIRPLIDLLSLTGEAWTSADLSNLPRHGAVISTTGADGGTVNPFTVRTIKFADKSRFVAVQGGEPA